MPTIRRGRAEDLPEITAIQEASPEASHWDVPGYLDYDFWVAVADDRVTGFLVARSLGGLEFEVLNIAVAPANRGKGVARALLAGLTGTPGATIFLEVRESNSTARNLYKSLGFQEISVRPEYYHSPPESGIVMKFHSC